MVEKGFLKRFQKRFLLRFHMSLILSATCLSGVLFSKLLYALGLHNILIRYPLVACLSYLLFFAYIKLWLCYVASTVAKSVLAAESTPAKTAGIQADLSGAVPDFGIDIPGGDGVATPEGFSGGGGNFGGGGASAGFGNAGSAASSSSGGGGGGFSFDLGDDGLAFLALGILIAVVLGSAIFLVYSAPAILSEAAFEFMLAGGLIRRAKKMDDPDWVGSIFRSTWKPFAVVLVVTIGVAWFLHSEYPDIHRIADLFEK